MNISRMGGPGTVPRPGRDFPGDKQPTPKDKEKDRN